MLNRRRHAPTLWQARELGTAEPGSPEEAVVSVFPILDGSLPPPTPVEAGSGTIQAGSSGPSAESTMVEFQFEGGMFIDVMRQVNGKYIVDHFVMCEEVIAS
jgi:hypothetical protein